jgi:hypothetical protein
MFIEDKLYTASEVSGGRDIEERLYSFEEITLMEKLFSEYYESNLDFYGEEVEKAYSDFYDAYSSGPTLMKIEDKKDTKTGDSPKFKVSANMTRGAITGLGAGAGLLAAKALNKKDKARKDELTLKVNRGQASKSDIIELNVINKRLRKRSLIGTVAGAGVALGGTVLASNLAKRKKSKDTNNS